MSKARPVYGLGQRAPQAADWPRLSEAWAAWGVIWRWTQPEETCEPALSTVNPASCGIYDSQGTLVEPRSLLSRAARVSPRACWPFGCLGWLAGWLAGWLKAEPACFEHRPDVLLAAQLSSSAFQRVNSAVGPPADRKRKSTRPVAGGGRGGAEASPCATAGRGGTAEKSLELGARELQLASERLARAELG